jgi:hypothetical protein
MTDKRLKRPRDPVELGKLIGDILTGQVEDRVKDDKPEFSVAQKFAQSGGLKGGKARAATLTAERRREIAMLAAKRRWGRKGGSE